MYRVRGSDQKEYGPISADQLRQWIDQNRANAQTLVMAEGTGAWKPLAEFPEFAVQLRNRLVPPAFTGAPGTVPVKTSGLAIASLVLGVLGFCGITAVLGFIFGLIAQNKIKRSNGQLGGGGLALAGIITSAVMFFVSIPFLAALFLPALAAAKYKAQTINCVNNMKQLRLAVRIYSNDHDDKFPNAATWCDDIQTLSGSPNNFQCNAGDPSHPSHYGYNARLSGLDEGKINPQTVMLFEADGGWNISGGPEALKRPSRHHRTYVVAFADGSVRQVFESNLGSLRWDP